FAATPCDHLATANASNQHAGRLDAPRRGDLGLARAASISGGAGASSPARGRACIFPRHGFAFLAGGARPPPGGPCCALLLPTFPQKNPPRLFVFLTPAALVPRLWKRSGGARQSATRRPRDVGSRRRCARRHRPIAFRALAHGNGTAR